MNFPRIHKIIIFETNSRISPLETYKVVLTRMLNHISLINTETIELLYVLRKNFKFLKNVTLDKWNEFLQPCCEVFAEIRETFIQISEEIFEKNSCNIFLHSQYKNKQKVLPIGKSPQIYFWTNKMQFSQLWKKTGSQKLYAKSPEKNWLENWIKNNKEKIIWRIKVSSRKYCWHTERSFETWPTLYIEYSEELPIKFQEKI